MNLDENKSSYKSEKVMVEKNRKQQETADSSTDLERVTKERK